MIDSGDGKLHIDTDVQPYLKWTVYTCLRTPRTIPNYKTDSKLGTAYLYVRYAAFALYENNDQKYKHIWNNCKNINKQ